MRDSVRVSLFVRLWVEMLSVSSVMFSVLSASSWGCELKCNPSTHTNSLYGQPLREAVSWNVSELSVMPQSLVSLFVRLWVEMLPKMRAYKPDSVSLFVRLWVEIISHYRFFIRCRQPLREAVSWNRLEDQECKYAIRQPLREAVSWNKRRKGEYHHEESQPLREAVSWNNLSTIPSPALNGQPLREAVSWNAD